MLSLWKNQKIDLERFAGITRALWRWPR
jgi:hypothetical protein